MRFLLAPSNKLSEIAPWFVPACIDAFRFLETEHGFEIDGRNIAYETVVTYKRGTATIEAACEVGFMPRVFINDRSVKDELADEAFQRLWLERQHRGQFDPADPEYHRLVRETLLEFAKFVRAHDSLWR